MHTDHILGLNWCQKKYGVIAEGPDNENHWVEIGKQWAKQIGYNIDNDISPLTKSLSVGFMPWGDGASIEIIPTPGHSPGHLSYAIHDIYSSASIAFFCGDVMFENGIGRYDFPDSNYEDLQKSIEIVKKAFSYQIYPGHGEPFIPYAMDNKPNEKDNPPQKKSFWRKLFGN